MPESSKIDTHVQEQAAAYFLDLQDGTMTGDAFKAWQDWMAASPVHRRAFARIETLMGVLDTADDAEITKLGVTVDDQTGEKRAGEKQVGEQQVGNNRTRDKASGSVLSLMAPDSGSGKSDRRKPVWTGAIAASIAAFAIAGYLLFAGGLGQDTASPLRYETAEDQQRAISLADGSIVELGSDAIVTVSYTDEERHLHLQAGEAVFTVAKNPKRPFVVQAGQGSVTAIGTVFNVRTSDASVQVRVLEGTVAVRPTLARSGRSSGRPGVQAVALVTAGRETSYSRSGRLAPVVEADVNRGLGWRMGVLTMVDWPIEDVIAELNRYLTDEITIGDTAVGDLRFTGTVYPDQVSAWLDGLQEGYPIEVVRLGGNTILMMSDDGAVALEQ